MQTDWKNPDTAYANGDFISGGADYPPRWMKDAESFRQSLGARAQLNLPYGDGARHQFDLFMPESEPRGLLMFVHGGYWLAFGRETWSHFAYGAVARGWACAMPSYTLAPGASIAEMTREIRRAVDAASARVPGPLVVTGHSAGGHLSARMACEDGHAKVVRAVPISPLSELEPLMATAMQGNLKLTPEICASESPARLVLRKDVEAHVWVGGNERPAFLWHARHLSECWGCDWTVEKGRHHFDIIDGLRDPNSTLIETCLAGL